MENTNRSNITFQEYKQRFYTTPYYRGFKYGQSVFNYVYNTEPDIAETARIAGYSPFHDDSKINMFWIMVEKLYTLKYEANTNNT
jgi:hypothetical protein